MCDYGHTMNNITDLLTKDEKLNIIKKTLNTNDIIFHEGDECLYLGIVESGYITISSYSFSGNEVIYNTLRSGDIFGNNLLFSSSNKYRGNVIAKEKSVVYLISKENLIKILQNNQDFLTKYLMIQSDFTKSLNTKMKLLAFDSAIDRFYYYMYINNNKITYKNVTELSSRLFLKRETLSRLLSKLEKNNEIIRDKNIIKYKNK